MDNGGGQEADRLDPIRHPIDPSAAVRDRFDATALLLLWLLRSTVPALLLGGLSYAWLVSETRFEAIPQVTTPDRLFGCYCRPSFSSQSGSPCDSW